MAAEVFRIFSRIRKPAAGLVLGAFLLGSVESDVPGDAGPRILLGEPVEVSGGKPELPHFEPYLAAHPVHPDLLFGAAITFPDAAPNPGLDATIVAGFRSEDGGRSWVRVRFPECSVDPWVSFGAGERLALSCLTRDNSVLVYRSADGGRRWDPPVPLPAGAGGAADRPVLAVDRSAAAGEGSLFVAVGQTIPAAGLRERLFAPSVTRSIDGGRTFSPPVFVRHDNLDQQPFDAAVLFGGSLVVLFMDFASRGALLAHRRTWMVRSEDGGRTFSTSALVLEQSHSEMPTSLAVDRSAPHRDRLYLAVDGFWLRGGGRPAGLGPGPKGELFVMISDDRGESWTTSPTVTDGPQGANCEIPSVAVNNAGVVGVAWYDTRRDPKGECFDIYFSASLDGGTTFLPNVRVTPQLSCPQAAVHKGLSSRWRFGGDYSGLAAGADGRFHIFWADVQSGRYQIRTVAVQVAP